MDRSAVMRITTINQTEVTINGDISDEEVKTYLSQIQAKQKRKIIKFSVSVDGEYVDCRYELEKVDFERIRRITGYLVGTKSKWNDAKLAEEKERVKHG